VSPTDLINNIGRPFDNTSAFVLDLQSTSILPRGAVGELCFGGYQVFQGYLHQPELTAAKIVDHSTYGRIYRSGDLGVMLEDDSILFVGRMDDQVKIRGQRVELGEITSAILD
jgi:non-ribosomal peptide synthetase component F